MPHKILADLIQQTYPTLAQAWPSTGRRQRVLKALHTNWPSAPAPFGDVPPVEIIWEDLDKDPLDTFINSSDAQGILLRTDFSDDVHWDSFIGKMKESERELLDSLRPGNSEEPPESTGSSSSNADVDMNPNEEEEEDEDEASLPESIITPFNPPPTSHPTFANISNLTALRLFNDLDVRLAMPPPPELEKSRYDPKNVLINLNGWQEIYEGKNIWIYDPRSIQDDCVRVVEQAGCVYGAATGDSWRARITHIPELQFNMAFLGMKIDFGGLDRWDAQERAHNLAEAAVL